MSTSALLTMIIVQTSVTAITIYFFVKVLRVPAKKPSGDGDDNINR